MAPICLARRVHTALLALVDGQTRRRLSSARSELTIPRSVRFPQITVSLAHQASSAKLQVYQHRRDLAIKEHSASTPALSPLSR